jgi:hypothetical protein
LLCGVLWPVVARENKEIEFKWNGQVLSLLRKERKETKK